MLTPFKNCTVELCCTGCCWVKVETREVEKEIDDETWIETTSVTTEGYFCCQVRKIVVHTRQIGDRKYRTTAKTKGLFRKRTSEDQDSDGISDIDDFLLEWNKEWHLRPISKTSTASSKRKWGCKWSRSFRCRIGCCLNEEMSTSSTRKWKWQFLESLRISAS